jgi:hypothetical protein
MKERHVDSFSGASSSHRPLLHTDARYRRDHGMAQPELSTLFPLCRGGGAGLALPVAGSAARMAKSSSSFSTPAPAVSSCPATSSRFARTSSCVGVGVGVGAGCLRAPPSIDRRVLSILASDSWAGRWRWLGGVGKARVPDDDGAALDLGPTRGFAAT